MRVADKLPTSAMENMALETLSLGSRAADTCTVTRHLSMADWLAVVFVVALTLRVVSEVLM